MTQLLDIVRPIRFNPGTTEGHKAVTIGTSTYNAYIPAGARTILMQATEDDVRVTFEGTTPTATRGFRLTAGDLPLLFELTEHMKLNFIGEGATSILQYCFGE